MLGVSGVLASGVVVLLLIFFLRMSVNSSDVQVVNVTFATGQHWFCLLCMLGHGRPPRKAVCKIHKFSVGPLAPKAFFIMLTVRSEAEVMISPTQERLPCRQVVAHALRCPCSREAAA